jgi:hypothetical protein
VLVSLPIEGEGYSGIHPAFCFVIACMCIESSEDFATLNNIMTEIGSGNKSVRTTTILEKPESHQHRMFLMYALFSCGSSKGNQVPGSGTGTSRKLK